jgi:hypothetical protein
MGLFGERSQAIWRRMFIYSPVIFFLADPDNKGQGFKGKIEEWVAVFWKL